ncbi:hypothetical protein MMC07_006358 [Pseudocyphellaria aurata]|nr:hypothetical protein [Pseudocyphellaria aurata]
MEKIRELSLTARQNINFNFIKFNFGKKSTFEKSVVSGPVDNRGPRDYQQVDTNHPLYPSPSGRSPLTRRAIRPISGPFKRLLRCAWVYEWSSIVVAILAMEAIYITLVLHRAGPLPQQTSMISINSLIAIFTVILKASLLMPVAEGIGQLKWHWFHKPRSLIDLNRVDAASRGPWGSFLLFTTYRYPLAALGAFITVVALAIEPFSQQVLQYYECLQPLPGSIASIAKTNNYTAADADWYAPGSIQGLENSMAAALYIGLIQPPVNSTSSILFQCPAGNCTFPAATGATHSSLAMCSYCTDISKNVTKPNNTNIYTLRSGPAIGPTNDGGVKQFLWMSSSPEEDFRIGSTEIFSFESLMYRVHTRVKTCANSSDLETIHMCGYEPFAINCGIYPCMKTYRANITNFVLEEELLNTTKLPMVSSESPLTLGFTLNSSSVLINGTWRVCDGVVTRDPNYCLWNFGYDAALALNAYLSNLFGGDSIYSGPLSDTQTNFFGTPWQMRLYSNGNATLESATAYMEGLANAITSVIRQHGDTPSAEYAQGIGYGIRTCINVRWVWLALPLSLIALTIVFLLVTILTTRSWDMTWKSSPLALLFHGMDTTSQERYGEMMDLPAMEDAAQKIQAKLAFSETGLKFVLR